MASTKGAALPSMIGTSGPSISTTTLSTPSPGGVAQDGGKFSGGDRAHVGANFALDRTVGGHALEHDAGVVGGGIQSEGDGAAGMHADAGDGNLVAQRCLLSTLHRTRLRRPKSKPHVPSQAPAGATFWPSNQRLPAIRKTPPRDRKVPFAPET